MDELLEQMKLASQNREKDAAGHAVSTRHCCWILWRNMPQEIDISKHMPLHLLGEWGVSVSHTRAAGEEGCTSAGCFSAVSASGHCIFYHTAAYCFGAASRHWQSSRISMRQRPWYAISRPPEEFESPLRRAHPSSRLQNLQSQKAGSDSTTLVDDHQNPQPGCAVSQKVLELTKKHLEAVKPPFDVPESFLSKEVGVRQRCPDDNSDGHWRH